MSIIESDPFAEVYGQPFASPVILEQLKGVQEAYRPFEYLESVAQDAAALSAESHINATRLVPAGEREQQNHFSELIDRYTEDPAHAEALMTLGAVFSAADCATIDNISVFERRYAPRQERELMAALKKALAIVPEQQPLEYSDFEITEERAVADQPEVSVFYDKVINKRQVFSLGEIREKLDEVKAYDAETLSAPEANLLVGVAVVQAVRIFDSNKMRSVLAKSSLIADRFKDGATPLAIALNLLSLPRSKDNIQVRSLSVIARELSETAVGRKLFMKTREIEKGALIIERVLRLPEYIRASQKLMQSTRKLQDIELKRVIYGSLVHDAESLVEVIDNSVDAVGRVVATAEEPDQRLMMDALVVDVVTKAVIERIRSSMLTSLNEAKLADPELYQARMKRLSEFSLHAALVPEIGQLNIDHLNDVYETLKTLTAERESRYNMSNNQLRRLDPGWKFMNLLRENNFGLESKVHAQAVSRFLFVVAGMPSGETARSDVFDRLILDVDAERHDNKAMGELPVSIKGVNGHGTHIEPHALWLWEHAERLVHAPTLPDSIRSMLEDLLAYKQLLAGETTTMVEVEIPEIDPDVPEIDDDPLGEILDPEFIALAEQLDWVVFPEGVGLGVIKHMIEDKVNTSLVNWDRLQHLVNLTDRFGGRIYISKDKNVLGTSVPYLVAEFEIHDRRFGVAECPEVGNATYIVCNETALGSWQELMKFSREDARVLGAKRVRHPNEDDHIERIVNKLNTMLVTKV